MPITDFLSNNARNYPGHAALAEVSPELRERQAASWREMALVEAGVKSAARREITWKTFDERANQFANLLLSRGHNRGDKIAILLMNCIEWLPVYFGILKAGLVAVPLNFRYSSDEIKYCLDLSDADALVFGPEFTERVAAVERDLLRVRHMFFIGEGCPAYAEIFEKRIAAQPKTPPPVEISETDDAAIYFSSGTTGFPKAILHIHAALTHACLAEQNHHGQTIDDVFLCIPPLYHTGAKMHWFGSLLSGGRAVLLRGTNPRWIIDEAAREKATIVWLLVPWAQDILDVIESGELKLAGYDLSRWRLMHIGAQPVPPSLIKRWKTVFPTHEYDTNYGLSESTGPGAVHLGVENIAKVGAIGKAGYGWQAKIVGDGEVGELAVKGAGVMKEYYKDPKATAEVLKQGWLYTGDMARQDEQGFIYLVDRKKDVVITGGENLYPVQIEDFMRTNKKIRDVAVIGLPDHRLGEIAVAIVAIKENEDCEESEIMQYCADLPRYKRPKRIIFDEVPRNATGKIEKPRLREKYAGGKVVQLTIDS
ncbi:hypothetical protein FACS1894217_06270 [Clostridia bacterium]|nr:hypothetical protein FACS1894217_06270 [Clostridia bacterium]